MIIPIRCFSCGKPIGHLWQKFSERAAKKKADKKKIMDELGLDRYCCRAALMGQNNLVELTAKFRKY